MRATIKFYWIKACLISLIAFALGVAIYVAVGIVVAHGVSNASGTGGFHQVTVRPLACECIVRFVPDPPLPGAGTEADPFVTFNARVSLLVGVSGAGWVSIVDADNNELWGYNKTDHQYTEVMATFNLPSGLGVYALTILLDGNELWSPRVTAEMPMVVRYEGLPIPPKPPGPPGTGGIEYLYIGGYAVQTMGVLFSGLLLGGIVFLIFVFASVKRRRQMAENTRSNAVLGKKIRREFSMGAIDKSGVVAKKRAGKGRKAR